MDTGAGTRGDRRRPGRRTRHEGTCAETHTRALDALTRAHKDTSQTHTWERISVCTRVPPTHTALSLPLSRALSPSPSPRCLSHSLHGGIHPSAAFPRGRGGCGQVGGCICCLGEGVAFCCHPFLSPSSLQTSLPGEGSCHTGSPGAGLGGWATCPQGYARPTCLGFSQRRRPCGPRAPRWEGPPGEWSLAGCRGSGDPHGWHPSGGPGTGLGLTKLVGEGFHPKLTTRQPSLVGGKPSGPALSSSLKPLVKGRSISHVPLAGGMESSKRTLAIHHQLMGTGVPER